MYEELRGKAALITGASRGIGAATAVRLAEAGVSRFLLHYGSFEEGREEISAKLQRLGASAEWIRADLGTDAGIAALAATAGDWKGGFDIVFNNAGSLVKRAKLAEYTPELYDSVMNLNVKSVYFVAQAVAPAMIARGAGSIVNVSSIAARNGGGPGATIYAAAKAAVSAITKGLSKELAPQGIRVNAVSPGTVDNDFHAKFSNAEILEAARKTIPAGTLGTNDEVADLVLYLVSNGGRYIHGQTIEVNGGQWMA
jgi:3-oxoacyl-[acyl-carrier protein] reductase